MKRTYWGIGTTAFALASALPAHAEAQHGSQLVLGAAAAAAQQTAPQAEQGPADTAATYSDEIIVTASKREERLKDVPSAITAISSDTISRVGVQDFRDYATLVPGLSQRDFGSIGQGSIILRGLNTSSQQTTNTTAFYLDEAPFSSSGFLAVSGILTPSPDLGDVERIEVLKGPQGTLYGATSLGGLVKVVSKSPNASEVSGSVRGEVSTTSGGDESYFLRGSVNLPIVTDKLAVRVSGGYRKAGGFIDNVTTGRSNVNDGEVYGGRIAVRATPTEKLTIDLVGFIQSIRTTGYATQDSVRGTLTPIFGNYKTNVSQDLPSKIDYRLVSGTIGYELGRLNWLTTVSYSTIRTTLRQDATQVWVPQLGNLVPAGTLATSSTSPNNDKFTVESRLTSERLGAFEFIAGVFYTKEDSSYPALIQLVSPSTKAAFADLIRTGTLSDFREIAGFGNVTVYFNDKLDLTGGIRVANGRDISTTGAPVDGVPASVFFNPRVKRVFRSSDTATTYLATLRWRPTENISTFLRAASGYRPGGPQTNPNPPAGAQTEVRPDTLWNYEAGIKGTFLDGALSIDASVYRIDWKDIQLPTLANNLILQANAGKARVNGFEAAITMRPSREFSVAATVGHTNAKLIDVPAGITASIGARNGNRLPLTPDWTASVLADYNVALSDSVNFTTGATLRFQSDMVSDYSAAGGVRLPSFETVDLRTGIEYGRLSLQIRAENVFNKLGFTNAVTNAPAPTQVTVIRPRTFTLSAGVKF